MAITKVSGKKNGLQKYRVRVSYTDIYGQYRQKEKTAYGFDEAKKIELQLSHDIKNQTSGDITVENLSSEYLAGHKAEVKETSYEKIVYAHEKYIIPTLGKYRLSKLTMPVLQQWKNNLQSPDSPLKSLRSKKNVYGELRAMLNYAVRMNYIATNPLTRLGNFKEAVQIKQEMQFYTPEEFSKFIAVAESDAEKSEGVYDWNYYVFFFIAFFTGMRKGEIYSLTWNDIENDIIHVTKSISQKLKGEDRITAPKNRASIRDLQIPKPLQDVLYAHHERCKKAPDFSDDLYICGGLRPVRDTSVQNKCNKYADMAGVKRIRIHDFRHSHASLLVHAGINIQEVARRLGHSKVSTTLNTYSHLYPSEQERAVSVLNEIKI